MMEVLHGRDGEQRNNAGFVLNLGVLAGPTVEDLRGLVQAGLHVGVEVERVSVEGIEAAAAALYQRLLRRTAGRHLCRIWNYLPDINAVSGEPPLETYRAFSRARARAFEMTWGDGFARRLPAASAVGGERDRLVAVFATCAEPPLPIENPEQLPAYEYPPEHGPRSPSFCRAMHVTSAGREWLFVSGTASIKGHRTIAPEDLAPQIACTLDNLSLVGAASGLGSDFGVSQGWHRRFKVYLRRAGDLAKARAILDQQLLRPGDDVIWLQADICRTELLIEIEGTLDRVSA